MMPITHICLLIAAMVALLPVSFAGAESAATPGDEKSQEFIDEVKFEGVVRAARAADISPRFDSLLEKINFSRRNREEGAASFPVPDDRAGLSPQDPG
jgi:hypothetical protein